MFRKSKAKLSTISSNISHLRKMKQRLEQTRIYIDETSKYDFSQSGSTLKVYKIEGGKRKLYKTLKPKELESLKNKDAGFRMQAIEWVEKRIAGWEYERIRRTRRRKKQPNFKVTELNQAGINRARENRRYYTDAEVQKFNEWLNSGSDGWKKNQYYHEYGARNLNPSDIAEFVRFMGYRTLDSLVRHE